MKKLFNFRLLVLIGVLIMSINQMWAWYVPGTINGTYWVTTDNNMGSDNSITFYAVAAGTYSFQLTNGSKWSGNGCINSVSGCTKGTSGSNATITFTGTKDITITVVDEGNWKVSVTASDPTYHLKTCWGGSSWTWQELTNNGDGTYSCTKQYNSKNGFNYIKRSSDSDDDMNYSDNSAITLVNSPSSTSDNCIYTFNPSTKKLEIRKCNTVTKTNYLFFDNSTAKWNDSKIQFIIGHASYSKHYEMSAVTNTKLYYKLQNGDSWSDAGYYAMIGNGTNYGDGSWGWADIANATHYSAAYLSAYNLANTKVYLINKASATNGTAITITDKGTGSTVLNSTQTVKFAVSTNGATPVELSSGTTPAQIRMRSYKFASGTYASVSAESPSDWTAGSSTYSKTFTAARTATTTLTVSNIDEDYAFLGWYDAVSGGNLLEDDETYIYYPTAATTVYARFSHEANHSVTISRYCTSTSTEINNTSVKVGEINYSSISAPEIAGYTFVNWSCGSGVVKHASDAVTANPIRVKTNSSGSGYTLTANYTEVLTTAWTLKGSFVDDFGTAYNFEKKSGESTSSIGYCTLTLAAGTTYQFKVIKDGSTWYGNSGTMTSANCTNWSFTTAESSNAGITTTSAGTYQFKIDFSGANPSVSVIYPPTLTWSATSVYSGSASTLTALVSNVAASKTIKYDVYAGATTTGDPVATWSGSTSSTTHSHDFSITPSFGGSDSRKQYTVKATYDGTRIATYTGYIGRKWDIYVHDVQSWGKVSLYSHTAEAHGSWPGTPCNKYNGSDTWYKVTLDGKATKFVLDKNGEKDSGDDVKTTDLNVDISTYGSGTYWYINAFKNGGITSVSITNPTVTLSATITSTNQINLTGNVSNFGGDGSSASEMKEVYFKVNNTKDAASITVSTTNGNFTKTLDNPTPDNTNNTLQAFAENIHGTGSSSAIRFTRVTLDNQSATTAGTANVLAVNGFAMAGGATAPTKRGYDFGGYYASTGGSGTQYYNSSMGSATNWNQTTATKTIYAKWTAKSCKITLDNQSATSAGTKSVTATFASNTNLTSAITCPEKTGWKFQGYWSNTNGNGVQVIAANGSWISNVTGYMSSGNWDYDGATTLYAYWVKASAYTFRYGTSGSEDWNGQAFTQVGATTTWQITNFTIPNKPNFYVGYEGLFYSSDLGTGATKSKSVTRAWTNAPTASSGTYQGQMVLLPAGPDAGAIGQATGATGTLKIYSDSEHHNLYVGFEPSGYGVTRASGTLAFVNSSGTWRETNVVTLNSSDASGNFQVMLKTSSSYVATSHGTAENASAVNGRKITGDANIANGKKGVFQMWTDNTTNNFGLRFVTVHDVTFNMQGHGDAISAYTDVRYNNKISAPSAPSATGYTFGGWYKEPACTNAWNFGSDVVTAATTLYAKWTAKEYAITLDQQSSAAGYGTPGDNSLTATFDAVFPSATMPTAGTGYKFMGYWSEAGGEGTQFTNASGVLLANIASYSDASGHWIYDGTKTLYAYYKKAEITNLVLDEDIVETNATVGLTPTISPTPEGDIKLCFYVFHSNDNPLDPQPSMTYSAGKLTFNAGETSGTYKIGVALRTGTECGGGTLLDSTTISYQVAGTHSVTLRYKCGDEVIKAATTLSGIRPLDWSGKIGAEEIIGYRFTGWSAGDGVTLTDDDGANTKTSSEADTIKLKAIYDGYLTANYSKKRIIYFNNTLNWENVYVYFYKNGTYWNATWGTGCNTTYPFTDTPFSEGLYGQMQPVEEGSKIYYFDAEAAGVNASYQTVVFTELDQHTYDWFALTETGDIKNKVIKRDDYYSTKMPMYVPLAVQTPVSMNENKADYYWQGYWMNYPENTGYTLKIYNQVAEYGAVELKSIPFEFTADKTMPMELNVDLEAGKTYGFKIWRNDGLNTGAGSFYGNTSTMTANTEGWDMKTSASSNTGLQTTAAGNYKFLFNFYAVEGDYQYRMSVTYPVAVGDYRLLYKDNVHTLWHPSAIIPKAKAQDTISFFVRKGQAAELKLQRCSLLTAGSVTWEDTVTWWSGSTIHSAVTQDSVYNICLKHKANGELEIENVEAYTGNYYIRTDAANSKWDNYRTDLDHLMTYSEYSITHGGYSHYHTHWVQTDDRKNIKFVIANDYSPCISDTLIRETASGEWANIANYIEENGDIKRNANVRFMWNQHDNTIKRAYVDGAQEDGSSFLQILSADGKIKNTTETETLTAVTFSDNGNWMYEANIKAQPNAQIKLKSTWGESNVIEQYFKGGASTTESLVGGSGNNWYPIRVIYDFKTNRLVASYVPADGDISDSIKINADVMFIREHQGDIAQLTFSDDGVISKINTAYGVLRLNKWTLNNKKTTENGSGGHDPLDSPMSRYERDLFYVSFPFRVSMEEVFGFGTYGKHWIIEYYDGVTRAANGYWLESKPNWKYVTNRKNQFFEPNQGYIIALDLDKLGETSDVWTNTDQVELFFPSYGSMPDITNASVNCTIPEHLCTINRSAESNGHGGTLGPEYDRRVKDSHWNVISVPTYVNTSNITFANTDWITTKDDTHVGPNFLYEWNPDDNSVTARSGEGYTYKAMHAYLVQYCGVITWSSSVSPAAAPRRNPAYRGECEFRLEMMQNDKTVDQAFVKLSDDEHVTTGFEFNYDLSKEFNKNKANIYTLIGNEKAAGNMLPLTEQTTVVPVGVTIAADGDYTFSIPEGTNGVGVTLIDTETGVSTPLSALDYTINLSAGTYDNRFVMEISPIQQISTDLESSEISSQNSDVRKVMIDQILYIVKDGVMYDARGARVQ